VEVDAGEGDDTVVVFGSVSPHTITLGTGADTMRLFHSMDNLAAVTDFNVAEGDVIDLRQLLQLSSPPANPATTCS
jgi:hypothetical protein